MEKAVNEGVRRINRSRMNAARHTRPANNPFLCEQWTIIKLCQLLIRDTTSFSPAAECPLAKYPT